MRTNWFGEDPGDAIPDGATIEGGNFCQLQPDTPIMVGKPLTICGGNWINVRPDPAWTIEGGNWCRKSYCVHLHPDWDLPVEPEACPHVVETEELLGEGGATEVFYHREDTLLATGSAVKKE